MNEHRTDSILLPMAALLLCAAAASPGHAVTVTNLSSNTVLFAADFEGGLAPSVGAWTLIGPSVSATGATAAPEPGPAEGAAYLRLYRDSPTLFAQGNVQSTLSSVQTVAGERIQLEAMVYVPDIGINSGMQFVLTNGDYNTARAWVQSDGQGNVIAVGPGFSRTDTGIDYTPRLWQRWAVQYEVGSATFSVSVANTAAAGFQSYTAGNVSGTEFWKGNAEPGAVYLDAVPVPEPGTWALMAAGLAAVIYRRRALRLSR